jgi:cbb3-type cytochrome oxidase subunit 3
VLQQLAGATGAPGWAIASMLFFLGVWLAIAVATWRARPEAMNERARLPLDGEADPAAAAVPRES